MDARRARQAAERRARRLRLMQRSAAAAAGRFHEISVARRDMRRVGRVLRAARLHSGARPPIPSRIPTACSPTGGCSSACTSASATLPDPDLRASRASPRASAAFAARGHRAHASAAPAKKSSTRSAFADPCGQPVAVLEARTYSPVARAAHRRLAVRGLRRSEPAGGRLCAGAGLLGAARIRRRRRERNALPASRAHQRSPRPRLPRPGTLRPSAAGVSRRRDMRARIARLASSACGSAAAAARRAQPAALLRTPGAPRCCCSRARVSRLRRPAARRRWIAHEFAPTR